MSLGTGVVRKSFEGVLSVSRQNYAKFHLNHLPIEIASNKEGDRKEVCSLGDGGRGRRPWVFSEGELDGD